MTKRNVIPLEFDTRMIEWNLKHNMITKDQLKTYLNALPDDAGNAEALTIEDEGDEGGLENGQSAQI